MRLKTVIRQSIFFKPLAAWRDSRAVREWITSGCEGSPPGLVKRRVLNAYRTQFNLDTLVETGTYLGDTVEFFRTKCARIFSIELSEAFARDAVRRFKADPHIQILQGDSGILLEEVLKKIDRPALFWLDGHYSGGATARGETVTPILRELKSIFEHAAGNHVILIDDARLFTGQDDYPAIDALRTFIHALKPDYLFRIENDIIRCTPK